ncbi:MAG: potassium channel family protein [Gammaproteobacteria bacterium]
MKNRFIYIIFAIMLVLLVYPFLRPAGMIGHFFSTLLVAMIPLSSGLALSRDKKTATIILVIATPFVILDGLNFFSPHRLLMIAAFSFATGLYFYIVILLTKCVLAIRVVTVDLIYCSISIYLLIGMGWAGVYTILESILPGSFSGTPESGDLLYFSFVTLTTVGYGDVLPLSVLGKRLAIVEGAMGSIYMAVIVAMIVGRYMAMHSDQDSKSETNSQK